MPRGKGALTIITHQGRRTPIELPIRNPAVNPLHQAEGTTATKGTWGYGVTVPEGTNLRHPTPDRSKGTRGVGKWTHDISEIAFTDAATVSKSAPAKGPAAWSSFHK